MSDIDKLVLQAVQLTDSIKLAPLFEKKSASSNLAKVKQDYYHTGGAKAEALNRIKLKQRLALAGQATKNGTTLELFAGRGNLTKVVYQRIAKRCILVDKDKKALEIARKQLDPKKCQIYNMKNTDFIKKEMGKLDLSDLSIVDFDAFGSITEVSSLFFEHFKVRTKLCVSATDGFASHIVRIYRQKDRLIEDLTRHGYPVIDRGGVP